MQATDKDGVVRTSRIITAALVMGLVFFLCYATLIHQAEAPDGMPTITYASLGFAVVAVIVRLVLPPVFLKGALGSVSSVDRDQAEAQLIQLFMTRLIISCAVLEGAAFFAGMAYMMERNPLALIPALLFTVGILLHFPSRSGLDHFLESAFFQLEQANKVV